MVSKIAQRNLPIAILFKKGDEYTSRNPVQGRHMMNSLIAVLLRAQEIFATTNEFM